MEKTNQQARSSAARVRTAGAAAIVLLSALATVPLFLHAQQASGTPPPQSPGKKNLTYTGGNTSVAPGVLPPPPSNPGRKIVNPGILQPPPGHQNTPVSLVLCGMIPGCVYPPPQITSLYADSSITPNGYVLVRGKNFNSANGSGGKLQFSIGSFVHDLVDLQWDDDSIRGRVPDGWNWKEQVPVDLWVVRADGARSAPLTPRPVFTPVYEIKMLRGIDISSFHCAPSDSYTCYVTDIGYGTVSAIHSTAWGLDSGTDSYQARLANGWVTDSIKFEVSPAVNADAGPPSGFQAGLDHMDIQVHWQNYGGDYFTGSGTSDSYRIEVFIRGPKGFPWNPAKP